MEAIKQLGTNGGGFLNANSATTFENPTGLTNWLSIYLLLSIPFALTYTFGKMVGSIRHGAALLAAMVIIFGVWVGFTSYAEHQQQPGRRRRRGALRPSGNTEGKEVRFGDTTHRPVRGGVDQHLDRLGRRLLRLVHPHGRLRAADRDDARRGDPGRHRERALHHPHLRHHRRVHRRPDDRANTGVPGEEDPGQGGEAGRPGGPGHADHRARSSPASPCRSTPGGPGRSTPGPTGSPRSSTASPRRATTTARPSGA